MGSDAISVERFPEGYAIATIAREPVNSMNLELWLELLRVLQQLERDPQVRGVIWASGLRRDVFTAGNDLKELHAPSTSQSRHKEFWVTQTTFLARLKRSPLLTLAAIRGACPAGGCCMALACDLRFMTENGAIGLNEVALGIPVPDYWAQLMARTIGVGPADRQLQLARMATAEEAKALGLVDQVTTSEQLLPMARDTMAAAMNLPDFGRHVTKERLHGDFARAWEAQAEKEAAEAWGMLASPAITKAIGGVIANLQKRSKPASSKL
eukprot:CAMPEP_0206141370 /NCGR_PEP_ID=MMETSP1473-20131121/12685_1 /ASSEMBLY_ACC=CAM_ASM_001109 /TAXON_ID=1461547 /ORGANISM="Stichococcus sp, Strain RCC1054" /LENGTH=267 /DNA_ID=CAMNT_0053535911 /DNA_START=273 /DNA_END=1076 /DNA_ORIENTATION=+